MKKVRLVFCGVLLSTCLAGNVFAGDFTGYGVFSFFDAAVNAVVSVFTTDPCEGRICTNCKPGSGGSNEGGDQCRPTAN
jgi:hypothetical protein